MRNDAGYFFVYSLLKSDFVRTAAEQAHYTKKSTLSTRGTKITFAGRSSHFESLNDRRPTLSGLRSMSKQTLLQMGQALLHVERTSLQVERDLRNVGETFTNLGEMFPHIGETLLHV